MRIYSYELNMEILRLVFLHLIAQNFQEILQVLDGTTGLNMLPQAREFNEVILCFLLNNNFFI